MDEEHFHAFGFVNEGEVVHNFFFGDKFLAKQNDQKIEIRLVNKSTVEEAVKL